MTTLAEIESAAATLPDEQKQELLFFVASKLRASGTELPPLRVFPKSQIEDRIANDEADMERFKNAL